MVSDGTLSDSSFTVTVTDDSSDNATSASYDGTYIGAGPIQAQLSVLKLLLEHALEQQLQQQLKMEPFQ